MLADLLRRVHPVPVYDLADRLASWEHDRAAPDVESPPFEDVRRGLREDHLPRLVAAGLVEEVGEGRYRLTERGLGVEAAAHDADTEASLPSPERPPGE